MSLEQDFGGVTISYSSANNLEPEIDYAVLLDGISKADPLILFTSRVGIAGIALLAGFLGTIFGFHLLLFFSTFSFPLSALAIWSLYCLLICVYHWLEFLICCYYHPNTANFDSFLVNQSTEFGIAMIASWIEFWVEVWFFSSKTSFVFVNLIGLIIIVLGQAIRSLSMIQAGASFTHLLAYSKTARHRLITGGLYRYLRHPGYFGWFYWSLGTQIFLCNPICFVAYFFAAQHFFKKRIPLEEQSLEDIFGSDYTDYKKCTWIGIPGIET